MNGTGITTLFLDIGGVLLTNGWDRESRAAAAETFGFPIEEMNRRHDLTFGTYEEGKISLDEYLDRTVFFTERPFSREAFKAFLFGRSRPFPEMLAMARRLKSRHRLKTAAVSNEGREIALFRNRTFGLSEIFDVFVYSCFVRLRKPDAEIFRLALDLTQARPDEVLYVENTEMFVRVAESLGIRTIWHSDAARTAEAFRKFGLSPD